MISRTSAGSIEIPSLETSEFRQHCGSRHWIWVPYIYVQTVSDGTLSYKLHGLDYLGEVWPSAYYARMLWDLQCSSYLDVKDGEATPLNLGVLRFLKLEVKASISYKLDC